MKKVILYLLPLLLCGCSPTVTQISDDMIRMARIEERNKLILQIAEMAAGDGDSLQRVGRDYFHHAQRVLESTHDENLKNALCDSALAAIQKSNEAVALSNKILNLQ